MGFGFDLSALTTTIGISFFGAPVSMELPYFSLSLPLSFVSVNPGVVDGDFNGENNVVANANQLREPPLVSAPYLNVEKNYTVMMFSADSVTDSSSLVWVACNLGATQLGFMDAAMTDVGLVVAPFQSLPFDFVGSVTTLVFEQTSNVAVVPTQTRAIPSTTLNLKLHAESITGVLLKPVAINWASVSPPSACLAANGVSLVGGQCLPDCTALLRLRRACSSCGTVSYAFSLVEPTTDITNMTDFANQVRNEIAGYLGLAPSAVAVTVDGSTVSVILAKTSEASLNTKVSTGQLPLQYNGKTFTSEALVIATTAATTLSTPSGSFSSQGPSATTSLQPTVSTSATATGPVSTPNGTASTTAVPSASTSSDSGGATAAIIIIVLLLLLIVGYLLLRKFGILEGSYCGGRVHLNPWSVSFDRMTNSCNKRTSSAGKNPYEAGRSTVSNPTYTDVSPDAPRGRTDSVA